MPAAAEYRPGIRGPQSPIVVSKTDANITVGNTSGVFVDLTLLLGGTAEARQLDVVVPGVKPGDWLRLDAVGRWGAQAHAPLLTFATIVAGAVVRRPPPALGVPSWSAEANVTSAIAGGYSFQVDADDIENGSVRMRVQVQSSAAGKVLLASGGFEFRLEGSVPFV